MRDSSGGESIVSIEELQEYDFIVNYDHVQLSNVGHVEQIYSSFLDEEALYVHKLEEIFKEVQELEVSDDNNFYFEPLNIFSRIDIIYYYHRAQFLPDLKLATTLDEIINTFFKHKTLLFYYEDFLRTVPFLKWMLREIPCMKDLFQGQDCILTKRLDKYKDMLLMLKLVSNANEDRVQNAVELIVETITRGHQHYKRDFPAAELIVTEMKYINRLRDTLDIFLGIFEKSDKYNRQKSKLYGKLPEIRVKQIDFLKSLENCLYDFNIIDIMDCFLKHKPLFELYVEDRRLKSQDVLAACLEECEDLKYVTDATLDRLFKYPQFFEKFKKIHKDDEYAVAKIVEVDEIFYKIQHDANNVIAIESIIDSNINVMDQGILLNRGSLKVTSDALIMKDYNKKDCVLFLFEKALIFTRETLERQPNKEYIYLYHIVTSSIKLNAATNREIQIFHTKSKTRSDMFRLSGKEDDIKKWEKKLVELMKKLIKEKNKFYNRLTRPPPADV